MGTKDTMNLSVSSECFSGVGSGIAGNILQIAEGGEIEALNLI
jgi:hypothetical protein